MIIAMLIGLISTWYGHNVALRVRSISSFSMGGGLGNITKFYYEKSTLKMLTSLSDKISYD